MTHLASAFFFIAALLSAAVILHLTVRRHLTEILLALRGELGLDPMEASRPDRRRAPPMPMPMRHAAS